MAWTHDTGYRPAYDHTGYPVAVQDDGTEAPSSSAPTRREIIGWRSACDCGWRGMDFYPRSQHPSPTALAPDAVDGWETGTAAFAEWDRHLHRVLPELAVHDRAEELAAAQQRLERAIHTARLAGVVTSRVAQVIGRTALPSCGSSASHVVVQLHADRAHHASRTSGAGRAGPTGELSTGRGQ